MYKRQGHDFNGHGYGRAECGLQGAALVALHPGCGGEESAGGNVGRGRLAQPARALDDEGPLARSVAAVGLQAADVFNLGVTVAGDHGGSIPPGRE